MGFCENAEFCKLSEGGAIICSLYGMRVAIGRELGAHVEVEQVAA
jgi:Fe2+ transport system protein FeoA